METDKTTFSVFSLSVCMRMYEMLLHEPKIKEAAS